MTQQNLFGEYEPEKVDPIKSLAGSLSRPLVVAYGGGVNSTAMLIGMAQRGIRPDLILFADTGGEKPETYAYLQEMEQWLCDVDFPELIVCRREPWGEDTLGAGAKTLEEYCLNKGMLPSIAYGWKTCSEQWKGRAQEALIASWPDAIAAWKRGEQVCQARGYDADEPQRAKHPGKKRYSYWYPLLEWNWGRKECITAIKESGLSIPPKSACFLCPSSRKHEVVALAKDHPDLFARAVAMEHAAAKYNTHVKGLGRRFSWEQLVSLPLIDQAGLCESSDDMPCECYDGETSEAHPDQERRNRGGLAS